MSTIVNQNSFTFYITSEMDHPVDHPAPSPCINVCVMDGATGWCTGCFRTIDEIVGWANAPSTHKWAVLHDLEVREIAFFTGGQ